MVLPRLAAHGGAGRWRRDRSPRQHWPEGTVDVYDLRLRRPCAGHVLWATNLDHLAYLRDYVSADLREGSHVPNQRLHHVLPAWMKDAKHRDDVLRCIAQLHADAAA